MNPILNCITDHRQGPLRSFDEGDLSTAQMALSTNPDSSEPQASEESASHSKLAFRRKLSDLKRVVQKVCLKSLKPAALTHEGVVWLSCTKE